MSFFVFVDLGCLHPAFVRDPLFERGYISYNMYKRNAYYYPVGTMATYTCFPDLNVVLKGSRKSTCQQESPSLAYWDPAPPECVIDGIVLLY